MDELKKSFKFAKKNLDKHIIMKVNGLTIKDSVLIKCSPKKVSGEIIIPDGITEIAEKAFAKFENRSRCREENGDALL